MEYCEYDVQYLSKPTSTAAEPPRITRKSGVPGELSIVEIAHAHYSRYVISSVHTECICQKRELAIGGEVKR